jgi:hypothetical protein
VTARLGARVLLSAVPEPTGLPAAVGTVTRMIGGPWSDHLERQGWELRVRVARVAVRVTYWCKPDGTIVLLIVFHKSRQHDQRQIDRAVRAQQTCERDHRDPAEQNYEAGVMTGYHTRWVLPVAEADDPERIAIREALAFGKAVYDRRTALSMTVTELAMRASMTTDEVECIEEGGTEPTVALLRRLAAALDADVRLTPGHDLGSVGFETHAA